MAYGMGTGFADRTGVDPVRLAESCFGRSDRSAQVIVTGPRQGLTPSAPPKPALDQDRPLRAASIRKEFSEKVE
jgi:hypothetical protein